MERVTGIGGVFFKARDPKALNQWYEEHLGVTQMPEDYDAECWTQDAGPTVWAAFEQSTEYFGRPEQRWMINFRVENLERMIAQLRAKGVEVELEGEEEPNGVFARLVDPEGNPIQLWEPRGG